MLYTWLHVEGLIEQNLMKLQKEYAQNQFRCKISVRRLSLSNYKTVQMFSRYLAYIKVTSFLKYSLIESVSCNKTSNIKRFHLWTDLMLNMNQNLTSCTVFEIFQEIEQGVNRRRIC